MASASGRLAEFDKNGEHVDADTFEQILEMDDDEKHEFSKDIVYGFFDQAENTFKKMDEALKRKELPTLSSLGHFLKGSSATLGLVKVRDSCEKIQHYGTMKEDANAPEGARGDDWYLDRTAATIQQVKDDYAAAKKVLRGFYGEKI